MKHILMYKHFENTENLIHYAGDTKSLIEDRCVPLTEQTGKILWNGVKIDAFHLSDWEDIEKLKNIQLKTNSISCFTEIQENPLKNLSLSLNSKKNGIMYLLSGDLLFKCNRDCGSVVDKNGDRWINNNLFPKDFIDELNKYDGKNDYLRYVYSLLSKHKDEILEHLKSISKDYSYNEVILSKTRVKKIIYNPDIVYSPGSMFSPQTTPDIDKNQFHNKIKTLFSPAEVLSETDGQNILSWYTENRGKLI